MMLELGLSGDHREGVVMPAKDKQPRKLQEQYQELFRALPGLMKADSESLEQPSPLKVVPSVTTYGAYEEPILGG